MIDFIFKMQLTGNCNIKYKKKNEENKQESSLRSGLTRGSRYIRIFSSRRNRHFISLIPIFSISLLALKVSQIPGRSL